MFHPLETLRLGYWNRLAARVCKSAALLDAEREAVLRRQAEEIRRRVWTGVALEHVWPTVFALGLVAIRREFGIMLHHEQVLGAIGMLRGHVVEMATGEGKTFTASLPVALRAFPGKGCHVVTSNDYLAVRDAEQLRPVFARLGFTTGCVTSELETEMRQEQYLRDITYGTGTEMGFDYLRDRLVRGAGYSQNWIGLARPHDNASLVQRDHYFALVDEADNLLIDDSKTPLIIGIEDAPSTEIEEMYRWASRAARTLSAGRDFSIEMPHRRAYLTREGEGRILRLPRPIHLDAFSLEQLLEQVERSLVAEHAMHCRYDYIVEDDRVAIVCDSTGRTLEGRKWQEGLHQAIEVKEQVPITTPNQTAASITIQRYFRMYKHIAGMTGTAVPARSEFARYYRLGVTPIPTHRPCRRIGLPPRVFVSERAKRRAVVLAVKELIQSGRAVLIGTSSISGSQRMSLQLEEAGIEHVVLNALQNASESAIVSLAGQPGRVTVATNMAGRGTDIQLHESVRSAGGLHVIVTEMNRSRRIDRQLVGRAARQGDPGSFQFFLSLEDEFVLEFSDSLAKKWQSLACAVTEEELSTVWFRHFVRLQCQIERRDRTARIRLFKSTLQRMKQHAEAGFDLCLEVAEST